MLNYKIHINPAALQITEHQQTIFFAELKNSFFSSEVRFYTSDKKLFAKYTIVECWFLRLKEQLHFFDEDEKVNIHRKINQTILTRANSTCIIKHSILRNKTDLIFNGVIVGSVNLLTYNSRQLEYEVCCDAPDLAGIFSILLLSLNINDGRL